MPHAHVCDWIARAIAAQFMAGGVIAMFELTLADGQVRLWKSGIIGSFLRLISIRRRSGIIAIY